MSRIVFILLLVFAGRPSASYFYPNSYLESQSQFLEIVESKKTIPGTEHFHLRIPTNSEAELYMDALHIPQQAEQKERLVIITSGIHGVEAFTGAAIQMEFLKNTLKDEWLNRTGFLIVHAVNPYGFHFLRRVDENNVDLNRNVSGDDELFQRYSKNYQEFEPYLNPQKPVAAGFWADTRLFLKSLWKLVTYGKKQIAQISVGGQYQNPKGIYFGGKKLQANAYSLQYLFSKVGKDYAQILHIDLHTGFGERGRLHFFSSREAMALPGFSEIFQGYSIDAGADKDFYKTTGDFGSLTVQIFRDKSIVIPMTFEFGTMDSQTIMGGFRSLRNMIYENQGFHHGYASPEDEKQVKEQFLDMFNPKDPQWRDQVLQKGVSTLEQVTQRFTVLKNPDS